jgi:uncharacterized membrane protein YkoI
MGISAFRLAVCSAAVAAALHSASGLLINSADAGESITDNATVQSPEPSDGVSEVSVSTDPPAQDVGTKSNPDNRPSGRNNEREIERKNAVRPYGWLLKRIKKAVPGDVVKVRLKQHPRNVWTYEVTVLNESGRYVQLSLNANTGVIISKKIR